MSAQIAVATLQAESIVAFDSTVLVTALADDSPLLASQLSALDTLRPIFVSGSSAQQDAFNPASVVATATPIAGRKCFLLKCTTAALTAKAKMMLDAAGLQCSWISDTEAEKVVAQNSK